MIKRIPTVSFCITCMNRFHQISRTLLQNLDDNRRHKHLVEFVLVDFGSTDGLRDWVKENCLEDIETGFLKYYYTEKLKSWNAPIAKNTSHLWAGNDILVNLDCDNYTGPDGGAFVIKQFLQSTDDIFLHQGNDYVDGSWGRIGVRREFFYAIGGYNEAFKPMLYEDMDIIRRLQSLGLNYIRILDGQYNKTIPNPREDSFVNMNEGTNADDLNQSNKAISEACLAEGRLKVNRDRIWGIREDLFDIYNNLVSLDR